MARSGVSTAPTIPFRIVLWLFGLITIIPLGLLLLTSFKSKAEVLKGAFALPAYPHFENYISAWTDGRFGTYFVNSVIVVVPVVGVSIVLGLITGFAFAYLSFPLKKSIANCPIPRAWFELRGRTTVVAGGAARVLMPGKL